MIKKSTWDIYISLINRGEYKIVFEHAKTHDRRVYIIYPKFNSIVDSCSYQAFRKYRKYLHITPGIRCNRMN